MFFIWNIYEKSFTPYFARLAPKHQVHRHKIEQKPCKLSYMMQDKRSKQLLRGFTRYIAHNTKVYHFLVIMSKKFK